jgi:hypothetical protein
MKPTKRQQGFHDGADWMRGRAASKAASVVLNNPALHGRELADEVYGAIVAAKITRAPLVKGEWTLQVYWKTGVALHLHRIESWKEWAPNKPASSWGVLYGWDVRRQEGNIRVLAGQWERVLFRWEREPVMNIGVEES